MVSKEKKINLDLWLRAKKRIPKGNMFYSKHPDRFLPYGWPTYFKSAQGIKIKDYNSNEYLDFSMMGIGTNVLGYANSKVDSAVKKIIDKGTMSTLNCFEEVELSETLTHIHKWADMCHYTRTGGEANSVAVRIARAATNKTNIAVCGYHGWHDWYIASNLNNKNNLNIHLLKGITTKGVQKNLKNTCFTFEYNNFENFKKIVEEKNVGIVKMEVIRNIYPNNNFLEKIRNYTLKNNIILIFDECTTGFRQSFGGIHKKFKIEPDIVIFGKALSNGYPINAIVGKKEIMTEAKNSFISSTYWSDRIGPVAALATIKEMKKIKSWKLTVKQGKKIKKGIKQISDFYKLKLELYGLDSIINFKFENNNQIYKTLITQEMLKRKILANTSVYVSTEHKDVLINKYLDNLSQVFKEIVKIEDGMDYRKLLKHNIVQDGFSRLN